MIIVITGTPGVGKTRISSILSERLRALHLDLTETVIDEGLILGKDDRRDSLIADLNRLSEKVQEAIEGSSRDVIIEGHYASDVVPPGLTSYVFVLRKDPEALKEDLQRRGFERRKVLENAAAEILDVCLIEAVDVYGLKKVCEIDVTGKRAEDVMEEIMLVLNGKKEPSVGRVDWLSKLEKEGRLEKFMDYS